MTKFNEVIHSGKTVLVDFSATWCGPCKMMEPILKELASSTGPDVKIIKVDVDKNQEAAMAYRFSRFLHLSYSKMASSNGDNRGCPCTAIEINYRKNFEGCGKLLRLPGPGIFQARSSG
jgi:thiol-disulfide isomerase/thioredoxin